MKKVYFTASVIGLLLAVSCTKKGVNELPNVKPDKEIITLNENNQRAYGGPGENMVPNLTSGPGEAACETGPGYCYEFIVIGELSQNLMDAIDGDFQGLQDFLTPSNIEDLSGEDSVIKQAFLDVKNGDNQISYTFLPNDPERVIFLFAIENPTIEEHDIAFVLNR